jgi:hypothetical protein
MLSTRGISSLAFVEKLEDYSFKLEFKRGGEEKSVGGGPGRHTGDTLIATHYDGWSRASEFTLTIALWVCFYDIPLAMIKDAFAKQMGGHATGEVH